MGRFLAVRSLLARFLRGAALRLESPSGDYISAAHTVRTARASGATVEEYLEALWGQKGETAAIVERMEALGALKPTDTVVEIGPGSGRYLARVRKAVLPRRHVVFETAPDWRAWLVSEYGVEAPTSDGESLPTVTAAGLIHAHGVFVYTPFLVTARYLAEMECAGTGWLIFDICTLAEFSALDDWLASPHRFPVISDRDFVLSQLPSFELVDEWTAPYAQGNSRYLALKRRQPPTFEPAHTG